MTLLGRQGTIEDVTKILKGHFDGKVIVPETPVDLPRNQRLTIRVESDEPEDPAHGTVAYLMKHLTTPISDEDAVLMRRAIDEADKNVEPSPDINLD
jgi:hypothetical protein